MKLNRIIFHSLFLGIVLITFGCYWRLLAGHFDHVYEPDTNFSLTEQYVRAITTLDLSVLSSPGTIAYFDSATIVYAIFTIPIIALRNSSFFSILNVTSQESAYIFGQYFVNIAFYSLGVGVFYRTSYLVTKSLSVSFLLALLFGLSPQILSINPLRIDYFISPFIAIVCYHCIFILKEQNCKASFFLVGVATAFLVTTKITGIVYLEIPAFCFFLLWHDKRFTVYNITYFAVPLVTITTIMMTRYIYHNNLIECFISGIQEQQRWTTLISSKPYSFYNIENFDDYGITFLLISILSILYISYAAIFRKNHIALFTVVSLCYLSALLLFSPKLPRWGHPISYFYFLSIAITYGLLLDRFRSLKSTRLNVASSLTLYLLTLLPTHAFATKYISQVKSTEHETQALQETKLAPMELFSVLPKGNTCILIHSDWIIPPINNMGFSITYGPFMFPYKDPIAMGSFGVPDIKTVINQCNYIIIDEFHRNFILSVFYNNKHHRLADDWSHFFDTQLRKYYDSTKFVTHYPEWSIWNLDIFIKKSHE